LNNDKKITKMLSPGYKPYFLVLFLFTVVTFYLRQWVLGGAELVISLALSSLYIRSHKRKKKAMMKYLETMTLNTDIVTNDSLVNMPTPMVLVRVSDGEIIWCNDSFMKLTNCPAQYFELMLSELIPGFDLHWIMEGKSQYPELVVIGERYFDIHSSLIRPSKTEYGTLFAALYWYERTSEINLRAIIDDSQPVAGELICDNYEEIGKAGTETARTAMMASLDEMLNEWISQVNGLIKHVDRDRYVFIIDEKGYRKLASTRFDILEKVKSITLPNALPLTISIGIGKDGSSLGELERHARLALDMALSRGGDQIVVKSRTGFEFFGGLTKEVEKRTKVKTRLMANVLKGLMEDSSSVYIMGHRVADLDSLGGAAGIVCAARKLGKKAFIIIDREITNAEIMIKMLESNPAYEGVLISANEAILDIDKNSLLVVVDTNRTDYVEDKALLESFNRIVVIDHHRRVADYISDADLNLHEPAASSVCEIIAETLQYIVELGDILRVEATAMLAGIILDTKSFSLKTGSRTYEAAAYLRRAGADTLEIKKFFQNDMETYIQRADLVKNAEFLEGKYAISISRTQINRAVAAQASDDLMNISGVAASFVIYPSENTVCISARSLGSVNVQLIMEKLGGGGHFTTAGAQIEGKRIDEVKSMLKDAITMYNFENHVHL
jgi:c-di-AMP phosphodiesterase-like protein